jgi:DNA-binding NarL/FixJ family response regulator
VKDGVLFDSSNKKQVTILLVDDHPLVCKALRNELEKEIGFKVVAEAGDGYEAVKLVSELKPDLVVMDIGLPKLNGIEATQQIKALSPGTLVLVLTVYDDVEHVLSILESGADGYLTKNILAEDIIKSIHSVVAGESVLSSQILQQVLKYALRYSNSTKPLYVDTTIKFTAREIEVLTLVAKGLSNKEIAEVLGLGIRTVKSHLVDIFSKLNVLTRTQAVIVGLRIGLLKLEDLN